MNRASVIVCTRDRAASLQETLKSLAKVAIPAGVECELLIVDNGSRDDTARVAREAAPEWIQTVSSYNPVDWTVVASREALSADPDWGAVFVRLAGLFVVAVVTGFIATRAFRAYQRSL